MIKGATGIALAAALLAGTAAWADPSDLQTQAQGPGSTESASIMSGRSTSSALDLSAITGASWTSGDYGGGTSTSILTVPVSARAELDGIGLTANVPWMRIRTGGQAFTGIDGTPIIWAPGAKGTPKRTYEGWGDLTLGADWKVPRELAGWSLTLNAKVKVPTGSDQVSTGHTDVSAGGLIEREGRITPFVSVSYRWFGDSRYFDLRNGIAAQAGASAQVGPGVARLSYAYARSPSPFVRDSHEILGAYGMPVGRFLTASGYASAGLSSGAPGYGVGLLLTFRRS